MARSSLRIVAGAKERRSATAGGKPKRFCLKISLPFALLFALNAFAADEAQIERGKYLATAANCQSCHTRARGEAFAGGLAFTTDFGTIYSTNITPDRETGIGNWSEVDFERALRSGEGPDGKHYYPAFPYTAFTGMSDDDVSALYAYLMSVPAANATTPENDLSFPYSQRWLLGAWKWRHFDEGRFVPDDSKSAEWKRGAYLVKAVAHCGACHSPRTWLR